MVNIQTIKEQAVYFTKRLIFISLILFSLHLFTNEMIPIMDGYKIEIINIADFIMNHAAIFIITMFIAIVLFYTIKSIGKKIRFLFSEETTVKDIYEESLDAWKAKNYDSVYENMNYIYQMSQKENIHNVYTETAKATIMFQRTDFSAETLTKEDAVPVIDALISTYNYKELNLNTIHLSYSFLHLIKMEEDISKKAVLHLIVSFLFSRADPVNFDNRVKMEARIFQSYFEQNTDSILNLISNETFQTMTHNSALSEEEFRTQIIPFLAEQT
ncbi:hypothetical protein [Salisediminibacterium halotolerans]|uniref:hypothetical protein n=1 Tax=Salisediminibacterium halotolerans TaxID=517425 RepID=UPI000EB29368|nr:hypothetical protein [Salisediminibacterium halotolerans]RLJ75534.1 hypothetical protein BCL39_1050 [Actinophytocola xinjiangensis]RPE89387.1 hypothetical protein EDD67_0163 [Salisediminibacterium halotolerans]TWG36147.1 hypothetical protein BCL52_1048 [Salisediminibacterium halotolerans]GEL07624.1 hypothetical protein SHA02_10400 [Salisediminibacterium halotolerans]